MHQRKATAQDVITTLDLEIHDEGGYLRSTYEAEHRDKIETPNGPRYLLSSIYYLLTEALPVGEFHFNRSDILHFYHSGNAIEYFIISADGSLQRLVMGSDILAGQHLQLHVPGGFWKASRLLDGPTDFGLISEAVSPGFDYADMEKGSRQKLTAQYPQHRELIAELTREGS